MIIVGVMLTVLLDGAFRSLFAPIRMPIGTLPFCFAGLILRMSDSSIPGFESVPLAEVATAEDHLYAARIGMVKVAGEAITVQVSALESGTVATQPVEATAEAPASGSLPRSASKLESLSEEDAKSFRGGGGDGDERFPASMVTRGAIIVGVRSGTSTPSASSTGLRRARSGSLHGGTMFNTGSLHGGSAFSGSSAHGGIAMRPSPSPSPHTLHGGSQHNERMVARKLAALATTTGHGEVVVELAMRAASAVGVSPTCRTPSALSREASNAGHANFAEAMQSLIAADQEEAAAAGENAEAAADLGAQEDTRQ